jgi:hypothetical protein
MGAALKMKFAGSCDEEGRLLWRGVASCCGRLLFLLRTSGQVVDDSRVDVDGGDVMGRRKKELRVHFGREYLCVFADYAKPHGAGCSRVT